jgi:hypothetical protein
MKRGNFRLTSERDIPRFQPVAGELLFRQPQEGL